MRKKEIRERNPSDSPIPRKKNNKRDKEVVDVLTNLGTPTLSSMKITTTKWVQPRRRRSNKIKKIQKNRSPIP